MNADKGIMTNDARQLSTNAGKLLLEHQNSNISNLIGTERSVFYLNILYTLVLFRRNHELEPLNEDILNFVIPSQQAEAEGNYDSSAFNQDMRQLEQWELITKRIERERLRGYKDTRREKFRYRIAPQALAFLLWLEEQLREALEPQQVDTRDLLEEVVGGVRELQRTLNKVQKNNPDSEKARSAIYRLLRLGQLSLEINQSIADFNTRLVAFTLERYDSTTARMILRELDMFLKKYINRIQTLRREIVPELKKLISARIASRWTLCQELLAEESKKSSLLMHTRSIPNAKQEIERLIHFYELGGQLDHLCARIRNSALDVMRKLTTHLRELERKSHRFEDLRDRISEMASHPEEQIFSAFINELIAPARMITDMNYWNASEKADPPQPRFEQHKIKQAPINYLQPKPKGDASHIRSLNDEKLDRLKNWFERTHTELPASLSQGTYSTFDDHTALIEFARLGLLSKGRDLAKRNLMIQHADIETSVEIEERILRFNELMVSKVEQEKSK